MIHLIPINISAVMPKNELGKQLLALCKSARSHAAEVDGLLESLAEDERREVVRYMDEVIKS